MKRSVTLLSLLTVALSLCHSGSSQQLTWTNRTPGLINPVNAVTFRGGRFVAVGSLGSIWYSDDGANWSALSQHHLNSYRAIAHGAGRWIGVGDGQTVDLSADGSSWIHLAGAVENLQGVAFGGDRFVAVGTSGIVLVSANGTDWLRGYPPRSGNYLLSFYDVAYGNGQFVAVGSTSAGTVAAAVRCSPDGLGWTNAPVVPSLNAPLLGVAYGNGVFVAVSANAIITSTDGQNWTNQPITITSSLKRVRFANGKFFAVGGDLYVPGSGTILSSSNGVDWTDVSSGPLDFVSDIAFGNGTYVAVGGSAPSGGMILQSGSQTPGELSAHLLPGTGLEVTIAGEVGRTYRLQAAPALSGEPWADLFSFKLTSPTTGIVDAASVHLPQRFYRLLSP